MLPAFSEVGWKVEKELVSCKPSTFKLDCMQHFWDPMTTVQRRCNPTTEKFAEQLDLI